LAPLVSILVALQSLLKTPTTRERLVLGSPGIVLRWRYREMKLAEALLEKADVRERAEQSPARIVANQQFLHGKFG
jgi:hypothetical protein